MAAWGISVGPPEWDLVSTAIKYVTFGQVSPAEYQQFGDDYRQAAEHSHRPVASPLGRIIAAEDIAALMHFLAADDCPVISGQALSVDAGALAGFSLAAVSALAGAAEAAAMLAASQAAPRE